MKKRFFSPAILAVTATAAFSGCAVVTPRGPAYYEPAPARVWVAPPPPVWVAPPRVVVVPSGPPGYYRGRGHHHDRDDWHD